MRRALCYLKHRTRHTVIFASPLPWPLELIDPAFESWCPSCDTARGRKVRVGFGAGLGAAARG